ncbi:ATP-binding protein [Rhodobacteraceae bacterium HSP-20]|uniref:ATP-binding protein n=1 Tax=Paragemmobacter amnigenus TaxID=2852097 RepID=A0ABS6J0I7_9RHOB|nr:ATP-binding protein [Rhodobacter amnigenus]MBU9697281.1 ATP-binding protein [Rhodobacter amnigenus]MBV4388508.1 ATP-binding protein [Rhodobacter amnigenus]
MTEIIVSRRADATPHAAALIEGLRDIGYSLETAISDIIDNSITAGAHRIEIVTETYSDEPYIAVIDDGAGMTEDQLVAAMRPGSRNPLATRDEPDLGRFGLGLKSASFSQCRRLTVVTRRAGQTSAAIWDLDDVAERNEWAVQLPDQFHLIPGTEKLRDQGTLVLWQKLDRLTGGYSHSAAKRAEVINQRIAETERHLRLVFHRFMEDPKPLRIVLNERLLRPLDPFAGKNPATISDPEEKLSLIRGDVEIQSFTLPHHKQMSKVEWEDIGGPEGHLKSQGFYLYRGRRLILYGTWFGLCRQSELTKLSRVRIDIPNSMDADWKIDVKKSSAQLPPIVRERLKKVIERIIAGSKRTYSKRGQKLVDQERLPMWHRIQAEGQIRYRPNIEHPAFADFAESLPPDLRRGFFNCIALVGASLPIETLHADMAGTAEQIVPDRVDEDTLAQAVQATLSVLLGARKDIKEIKSLMKDVDPFRSAWEDTERIIAATIETKEDT